MVEVAKNYVLRVWHYCTVAHRGRELERLVAMIELMLGGEVVEVESPSIMRGMRSGAMRELDVLATATVGSARVRVVLEVRDHSRPQGPSWIEQIAAKRRDVDADIAIAVSKSGFTTGAQSLAESEGIQLRTVKRRPAEYVIQHIYGQAPMVQMLVGQVLGISPVADVAPARVDVSWALYPVGGERPKSKPTVRVFPPGRRKLLAVKFGR